MFADPTFTSSVCVAWPRCKSPVIYKTGSVPEGQRPQCRFRHKNVLRM
uniref:Uncharacterized protein n=1 Tax=Rhizophora mucronata TaxID=61149 RepID=A0A2P2QG17_RHIMU